VLPMHARKQFLQLLTAFLATAAGGVVVSPDAAAAGGSALSPLIAAPIGLEIPGSVLTSLTPRDATTTSKGIVFVDCSAGSDAATGASPLAALKTVSKALTLHPHRVEVSGGWCSISEPLQLVNTPNLVVHGDGKTAISGGRSITGWVPARDRPHVLVADVTDFPTKEIKLLRVGATMLSRGRWPKLTGSGLTTPNFLFAMKWSKGASGPNRTQTMHLLGVDPTRLPAGASLREIAGNGFVCVSACACVCMAGSARTGRAAVECARVLAASYLFPSPLHPSLPMRDAGTFSGVLRRMSTAS
jgi:hypothetical protein